MSEALPVYEKLGVFYLGRPYDLWTAGLDPLLDSDPLRGREHILLSTIFDAAWRAGTDLDLAALIQQIQKPPVDRIGVLDLETFYPAKERFALAMACNSLLGAPGFAAWLTGEPLDVDKLLYTPAGKPRVAVLSIAHLSDRERMFFVALLLNQTIGWMRSRPGTTSLRAILCMDEVFGYMPPVAEPPSKRPLLTLLKQARAFGLGLVLATQNPVDLDYKGLSNVGTWLLGRLQTDRDKQRLLDGLEGVAAGGAKFDRAGQELHRLDEAIRRGALPHPDLRPAAQPVARRAVATGGVRARLPHPPGRPGPAGARCAGGGAA